MHPARGKTAYCHLRQERGKDALLGAHHGTPPHLCSTGARADQSMGCISHVIRVLGGVCAPGRVFHLLLLGKADWPSLSPG